MVHASHTIRHPVVAGQFYPDDPAQLREEATRLLGVPVASGESPAMLVMAPHAGYVYSGAVAGESLSAAPLARKLLLLGPNHTGRGKPVAVWPGGQWHTPLGPVPVDADFATCLVKSDAVFALDTEAHTHEHSLEVLLPFVQVARPDAAIVPVAVGAGSPEVLARVGAAMARCIRASEEPVTIVVSTDMSHYVSHEQARRDDRLALTMVETVDPEGLYTTVREQGITMCGVFPMTAALVACRLLGAQQARLVRYATSGEVSGDMQRVVGYAGAVITA